MMYIDKAFNIKFRITFIILFTLFIFLESIHKYNKIFLFHNYENY